MYKFFDYLLPDLPVKAIGELAGYIRRFTAMQRSDIPVEGHMGGRGVLRHPAALRRRAGTLGAGGAAAHSGGCHGVRGE